MPGKPKILFVDDQGLILAGLRRALNKYRSQWDIQFTESPEEALQILKKETLAVIVSDMRMPRMNGAQLLNAAREHKPDTVRILLTGQADIEDAESAINEGQIFRFLTKPCMPGALTESIKAAVEHHEFLINH